LKSAAYIYLITRAHGLSTHLLSSDDFKAFARLKDLNAFVEAISKGDYAEKIGLLPREKLSARDLSSVFSDIYVYRLLYLLKVAPQPINKFLDAYTRKVEIENIKRVLIAKFYGLSISLDDLIPLPRTYSIINFQAMVEAESIEDAISMLMFTKYKGVGNYVVACREHGTTIPLEAFLDRVYYKNIYKYVENLPDKGIVRNIIGFEVDIRNLYYVLAYKILGTPLALIEESIIKPTFRLTEELLNSIMRARIDVLIDSVASTPYGWISTKISSAIENRSIEDLEYTFNSIFYDYLRGMSIRNPLGLGYVIWYLNAIYYEYRNLTSIAVAKELGVSEDEIKLIL